MVREFSQLRRAARWPAGLAVIFAAIAYCQLHGALTGAPLPLWVSARWGLLTTVPWLIAISLYERQLVSAPRKPNAILFTGLLTVAALVASAVIAAALGGSLTAELYGRAPLALLIGAGGIFALGQPASAGHDRGADGALPCHPSDVLVASAAGNYVEFHLAGGIRLWRGTMNDAEALLGAAFVRIHRRFIVPRAAIVGLGGTEAKLRCGRSVPVSRRLRSRL